MSPGVGDKAHGGCNFEDNLIQTQNCKFQKAFANCGVNFHNIVVSSIRIVINIAYLCFLIFA